jgi:hypothetical protein
VLSLPRGALSLLLVMFIVGLVSGWLGPPAWDWKRITLVVCTSASMFVVATVPEHFLREHLWEHVARRHTARILLWTFGALLVTHALTQHLHLERLVHQNTGVILCLAGLLGIIPESGPHLIFTTLYAQGALPVSVLITSSIVQDGHGMLPLLAFSRRRFIIVKVINLVVGLGTGLIMTMAGR